MSRQSEAFSLCTVVERLTAVTVTFKSAVSGANTGNGVDRPITTAYTYMWDIFDLDPSGSAWSRTLVNALQMKLNRTL
jgi:hypothetical protein